MLLERLQKTKSVGELTDGRRSYERSKYRNKLEYMIIQVSSCLKEASRIGNHTLEHVEPLRVCVDPAFLIFNVEEARPSS